ncbi:hypothetical protein IU459_10830 [Nocardia amamiensis]|uniref:Cbb3-type cytochrome c oxidase subunit 3 n=1 Tax=Nocardia amamiensis TaxID=404578 RepID=A0ABS0CNC5_9NOCA|nr:hypothetical protein [Nocardia amamiensis]MBF6298041.1 hypothetical protein [Nocardia amamiensis]
MTDELANVLIVIAAVAGLLIIVFWVLPWLIQLGESDEPDETVPFREVMERIDREDKQ